jgi:hypothetical protein
MKLTDVALIALLLAGCTLDRGFIPNAKRDYRACTTYEACILVVHGLVTMNWVNPLPQDQSLRAVLTVKLDEGARISGVAVARSSGNAVYDQSAIDAVYRTGDFQELLGLDPSVFNKNFREFNLDFNSAR